MRWWLVLLVAGCKAGVAMPDYGPPPDEATPLDLSYPDYATPIDLTAAPDACPMGVESCSDGCDNDGNGYADAEDPACVPIAIAGLAGGDAVRWTLTQPPVFHPFLTLAPWAGSAAFRHDVTMGEAWVSFDAPQKRLARVDLKTMAKTDVVTTYIVRDVCFFGGNVIAVEQGANMSWKLHQLKPDGTELMQVMLGATPAACASDGKNLYVAVHSGGGRSQFLAFDDKLAPVAPRAMPAPLVEDRCLDFAWTPKGGFYGLFAVSGGAQDFQLSATLAYPFAMDGGVGAPVGLPDGSMTLHSLGEFVP